MRIASLPAIALLTVICSLAVSPPAHGQGYGQQRHESSRYDRAERGWGGQRDARSRWLDSSPRTSSVPSSRNGRETYTSSRGAQKNTAGLVCFFKPWLPFCRKKSDDRDRGGDRNRNPSPDEVPLGGLEWLALAGAGYAAHRMRSENDEDDSPTSS